MKPGHIKLFSDLNLFGKFQPNNRKNQAKIFMEPKSMNHVLRVERQLMKNRKTSKTTLALRMQWKSSSECWNLMSSICIGKIGIFNEFIHKPPKWILMELFGPSRDDYTLISKTTVKQYVKPRIKESFCFIDAQRCSDRFVSGFAWHPTLSGVFVASYCFNTPNTFLQGN